MTASARHPAAQPRQERRRWGCSMTASAVQCPGSWSRKGGAIQTRSQVQWGEGGQLSIGSGRESRRDVGGPELQLERISWWA